MYHYDRRWERNQLLLSEQHRHIILNDIADICWQVWCKEARSGLPTPPTTPTHDKDLALEHTERCIEEMHLDGKTDDVSPQTLASFLTSVCARLRLKGTHLIVAMIFLERLRRNETLTDGCTRNGKCGGQAYVFCLMLAHKLCEDRAYDNKTWSHLTKYSVEQVNQMERKILILLDHRLLISEEDLVSTFDSLDQQFQWTVTLRQSICPGYQRRRSSRAI